jgi:phospho-N-acetylmuramoyl-pentapeptide-transferase
MLLILTHFLVALLFAVLLGGPIIALLTRLKARQVISLDAPQRHQAKAGTPSMGGFIFVVAGVAGTLLSGRLAPNTVALLLLTLGFSAIGFVDDALIVLRGKNLGLKARQKLALQGIGAIAFVLWYHNPAVALTAETGLWGRGTAFTALCHLALLVALSNAVNLTDGLDGLAAGIAVPVWLVLAAVGALVAAPPYAGDLGVAAFCAAFAGGCLGFLWFNAHPATVFMGDTGSLGLGAGMAGAAILLHAEWVLLLAAGVYLVEMVSVMLQVASFKTTGRRIFRMTPIHHHFELLGWAETKIVARFTLIAIALSFWALRLVVQQ